MGDILYYVVCDMLQDSVLFTTSTLFFWPMDKLFQVGANSAF